MNWRYIGPMWKLTLSALLMVALGGCDQNVKFTVFTAKLDSIRAGGARYFRDNNVDRNQCRPNQNHLDFGLLPLATTRDRNKVLLEPDSLLDSCTLEMREGREDEGRYCFLGTDDVEFVSTKLEYLGNDGEVACCGDSCPDPQCADLADENACDRDPNCIFDGQACREFECADMGSQFSCDPNQSKCVGPFDLTGLALDYVPTGVRGRDRIVALTMDNSGSLAGHDEEGIPNKQNATDRTENGVEDTRIAAADAFVADLNDVDRVAVYTFDGSGSDGVRNVTKVACPECRGDGFFEDKDLVAQTIREMHDDEQSQGSPVWDAVAKVADDLRTQMLSSPVNPAIILFTDGPEAKEDLSIDDAIDAILGDDVASSHDDIPVFIVHLDNVRVMQPPTGRYEPYERLACVSGGAYFYLDKPDYVGEVFQRHLRYLTRGRYQLKVGYSELKVEDAYPSGDYAISTQIRMTIESNQRTLPLVQTAGRGSGAKFDTRVFVHKP